MSSRDRWNRQQRPERVPRDTDQENQKVPGDEDDVDFETVDDDSADLETGHSLRSGSRASRSSSLEGTAEQIDRLRQSMSRGAPRRSQSTSRQSIGRNYFSRHNPEPVESAYSDDYEDDGEPNTQQDEVPAFRSASRRRIDVPRDDPYVTEDDGNYGSMESSSYKDDDEEPYYEDQDDFTEYDAPQRPGWQRSPARSGGTAQRQPITRPTLPPAITQADLVNDAAALSIIGIGILSLAGMAILVANRADSLAPTFPTHVSASGVLEDFRSSNHLWRLPLLSAMLTLMNIVAAWFISPLDRFASRFLLAAAVVVQVVAWVALVRIL
jgi:hypothetical protein